MHKQKSNMNAHVIVEQAGPILDVTLNRPDHGNRVTMDMIGRVVDGLQKLSNDTSIVVIRGAGADFCKGRDYQDAAEDAKDGGRITAMQVRADMTTPILDMYGAIKECRVPTLSIVQGQATGFGCALACSCDVVLAGEGARFCLPEMGERGLPPTLAMTALMDRVVHRALVYMVCSTEEVGGHAAVAAGLVSKIFPDHELDARAREIVAKIAAQPIDSIMAVNRYLKVAPFMPPHGRAELGSNLFAVVASSR